MKKAWILPLWLLTDLLVFIGSYVFAYFLRVDWIISTDFPLDQFILITLIIAPLWMLMLLLTRTFALLRRHRSLAVALRMIYAGSMALSFFVLAYYFVFGLFFSRLLLIYAFVLSTALPWFWHIGFDRWRRRILRNDPVAYPTLIIGATREAEQLIALLQRERSPLTPVAILDGRGSSAKELSGVKVEGKLNKLEETLEKYRITHLIQCSDIEQSLNLLGACRNRRITYLLLPSMLGIVEKDERIESLEGRQVTTVHPKGGIEEWLFS